MTDELQKKVDRALKLLRSIPQDGPVELCYSTGKDSDVILELAKMAGISFVPIYKNTTCDQPGSIAHARGMGVKIVQPKKNMLQLIEENGWPSRWTRFCCKYLKEYKIYDRAVLGIRRDESVARAKRYNEPEQCRVYPKGEKCRQYFPILDWTNDDICNFVRERELRLHPHYYDTNGNFCVEHRVGCIGCPMASDNGRSDFLKYPKILRARVKAYCRWWETHPASRSVNTFPSVWHCLYMKFFCHDMQQYKEKTSGLFGGFSESEMKQWLENYFGVGL